MGIFWRNNCVYYSFSKQCFTLQPVVAFLTCFSKRNALKVSVWKRGWKLEFCSFDVKVGLNRWKCPEAEWIALFSDIIHFSFKKWINEQKKKTLPRLYTFKTRRSIIYFLAKTLESHCGEMLPSQFSIAYRKKHENNWFQVILCPTAVGLKYRSQFHRSEYRSPWYR